MNKTHNKQTRTGQAAAESVGPQSPYDYPRRVLVMAVGLTPQVLTETLYALAVEAAQLMETRKINALLVVDGDGRVVGALNIHDLLRARVV